MTNECDIMIAELRTRTQTQGEHEMKYTANTKAIQTIEQIQTMIEKVILTETEAQTEVTIRNEVMIYTEQLDKVDDIKSLMSQARTFIRDSAYEADDDLPAGITLFFTL